MSPKQQGVVGTAEENLEWHDVLPHWVNRPSDKVGATKKTTPVKWREFVIGLASAQPEAELRPLCLSIRNQALEKGWNDLTYDLIEDLVYDLRHPYTDMVPVRRYKPSSERIVKVSQANSAKGANVELSAEELDWLDNFIKERLPKITSKTPYSQAMSIKHSALVWGFRFDFKLIVRRLAEIKQQAA